MNNKIKPFIVFSLLLLTIHFTTAKDKKEVKSLIDFHVPQSVHDRKPVLIAHRGGVITDKTPECSIAAIQLAKQQGYEMIELDVMKSKDGVPIVFHDSKMKKACGIDSRIADLNAEEIVKIHYINVDQRVCTLHQSLGPVCKPVGRAPERLEGEVWHEHATGESWRGGGDGPARSPGRSGERLRTLPEARDADTGPRVPHPPTVARPR